MLIRDPQEHSKELGTSVGRRCNYHTSYYADKHQADDVNTAIIRLPRGPGYQKRDQERGNPHGRSDQKRVNLAISQRFHYSREEVLEILGQE